MVPLHFRIRRGAKARTYGPRFVEPEWLDELPSDDPRALGSRRDLRRINTFMMNDRLLARELLRAFPVAPPRRIVEIGAGDGSLMLRVAARVPAQWRTTELMLLDRQDLMGAQTRDEFRALGWSARAQKGDVFDWLGQATAPAFDVIVANLFLHHFDTPKLHVLLGLIALRTRVLIASEPRRSRCSLLGCRALGLIGCNEVSRHDAVVSVHSGFTDCELSAAWPAGDAWTLREHAYGPFSHCFVAVHALHAARTPMTTAPHGHDKSL